MTEKNVISSSKKGLSKDQFKQEVLNDFRLANESRQASLIGRKEVLTGKAKFGIFGDGKEIAQIAMAKVFQNGDFRSGYYRDQTFMMAAGLLTVQEFFAQLYAHPSLEADPSSAGRSMNAHFSTRSINEDGSWRNLMEQKNSASDLSPTAGQIPRLLGLAHASKVYREDKALHSQTQFTNKGNEVAFGTIGDASTSEGHFWETMNGAAVTQVPLAISIWDDGYGISVPKKFQTVKESISEALKGFEKQEGTTGIRIFKTKGWDYVHLVKTYEEAIAYCRAEHVPVLIHVEEMTQPQGHSTSGSHERYKSSERLSWEQEFDCIRKLREFILDKEIATVEECDTIESEAKKNAQTQKKVAWKAFISEIEAERDELIPMLQTAGLDDLAKGLNTGFAPSRKEVIGTARKALLKLGGREDANTSQLAEWLKVQQQLNAERYNSFVTSETPNSASKVKMVAAEYADDAKRVDGREVLLNNFDKVFEDRPEAVAFGEDLGGIGGVNQGFEGLQKKHGEHRIFDVGIREASIMGQGIGMALRGLRPIAEIQYLDYLLYGLQPLSDDLASLQYRTKGGQKCPLIIRTRGHRLEGIWHAGSPMGMIINALRGIHICVPRNMTQAAGFYNTLLASDDPGLVIEPLNGYRIKEKLPSNLGEFKTPLGVTETISEGTDLTIVTYGSCVNLALKAIKELDEIGISAELVDVQTLLPFDTNHSIVESLKKTNRLLVIDEDVPGGASAYILQKILEEQKGYFHLDSEPKTLTAQPHRTAYGTDGDYFSKPSIEDMVEAAYAIMSEANPKKFPKIFG
ncbi:MAG: pyruvate/2-oxoglutarate/acetoin dehydrogenase E1 component/TPP-dependent pyruvate [Bacteroidia bacterium]|jgi:2-oxoisovalerate dehydrogenase E1 component